MLQLESGLTDPILNAPFNYSIWVINGWLKECWKIFLKYNLKTTQPTLMGTYNTASK